jgi:hypothetical protein
VAFGDPPRLPAAPRVGRHGPLSESRKLRTALVRALGPCSSCRERRVYVRGPPGVQSCGFGWY